MTEFPSLSHKGEKRQPPVTQAVIYLVVCIKKPFTKGETEGAITTVTLLCYWTTKGTQKRNITFWGSVSQILTPFQGTGSWTTF